MNGIGPEELKLKELASRLHDSPIQEIIIATNPTLEGEATAMYIQRNVSPVRRQKSPTLPAASPSAATSNTPDQTTLTRAFQGRTEL